MGGAGDNIISNPPVRSAQINSIEAAQFADPGINAL